MRSSITFIKQWLQASIKHIDIVSNRELIGLQSENLKHIVSLESCLCIK